MKKFNIIFILMITLGFSLPASASNSTKVDAKNAATLLASSCPKNCSSCWDQRTTSKDCGSGHKCVSSACGNRCTKE